MIKKIINSVKSIFSRKQKKYISFREIKTLYKGLSKNDLLRIIYKLLVDISKLKKNKGDA